MKSIKLPFKRLKYRTRALINIGCILLAILLIYVGKGFPYFTWEQDLRYTLRRSLAADADIIYEARVPNGCGTWTDDAEETVYLVRHGDSVGAMRMMRHHAGNSYFGGPNRYFMRYPDRGGLAIIPLHGAFPVEGELYEMLGFRAAVVALNPDIEQVDVVFTFDDSDGASTVHRAENVGNGVFIVDIKPKDNFNYWHTDVYNNTFATNYLGAVCYDAQGKIVAQTSSVWEGVYEHED